MNGRLDGHTVAILVADGFEQIELTSPRAALEEHGARTHVVAPSGDRVQAWDHDRPADPFVVDVALADARPEEYDALILPGGVQNPDRLRQDARAVAFVRHFFAHRKPVGAICHGPWTLIEADVVRGRRMTSYPSLRTDLRNAGAEWVDEEVVVDRGLVTSRTPADLDAFNARLLAEIGAAANATSRR